MEMHAHDSNANVVHCGGTIMHVFPFPRKSQKNNQPIIQIATNSRGLHLKTNFNSNFPLGKVILPFHHVKNVKSFATTHANDHTFI